MLFLAFFLLALAASAARPAAALKPDTIALCYGEWLACARAEPCRALLQEAYSCVLNPLQVKGAGGSSGCFAELSKVVNVTDIPELLSLDQCLIVKYGKVPTGIRKITDIPGVTPSKLWPYVINLAGIPAITPEVFYKCMNAGCNLSAPAPGDKLTVFAAVPAGLPAKGKGPDPYIPLPLAVVTEIITNFTDCVGLPGKCQPVGDEFITALGGPPQYRSRWVAEYVPYPVTLFAFDHFYDLVPIYTGGVITGTRFFHHEDYYGIIGFMLAEEVSAIFGPSFMAINEDFKAFALNDFQPIPANQGSGWTAKVWGEGKE